VGCNDVGGVIPDTEVDDRPNPGERTKKIDVDSDSCRGDHRGKGGAMLGEELLLAGVPRQALHLVLLSESFLQRRQERTHLEDPAPG